MTLIALLTMSAAANAMSYEQARNEALFLTDKMAYELDLTDEQYEAAYEINLDYLMGVTSPDDVYGVYWERRNLDMSYILYSWQWEAFRAASYFFRPLYWNAGRWHFGIYARYTVRDYFYFGRPHFYVSYRGGHAWHVNGGHSYYYGRRDHFRPAINNHHQHYGMRQRFDNHDYRPGSSTRVTAGHRDGNRGYGLHNDRGNNRNRGGFGNGNNRGGFGNGNNRGGFGNGNNNRGTLGNDRPTTGRNFNDNRPSTTTTRPLTTMPDRPSTTTTRPTTTMPDRPSTTTTRPTTTLPDRPSTTTSTPSTPSRHFGSGSTTTTRPSTTTTMPSRPTTMPSRPTTTTSRPSTPSRSFGSSSSSSSTRSSATPSRSFGGSSHSSSSASHSSSSSSRSSSSSSGSRSHFGGSRH